MKQFINLALILLISSALFAQGEHPLQRLTHPQSPSTPVPAFYHGSKYDRFYTRTGIMHLQAGEDFIGSSVAYFRKGNNRFLYGMNLSFLTVDTGQRLLNGYSSGTIGETGYLIPFWLSLKIRLKTGDTGNITPFILTGLGPTLGLKLHQASGFINSLSHLEAELGGGAFLGAGVDYIWNEEWAFSADIRYNYVRFNNPLGLSDEYRGLSFAIGFVRAFGQ